MRTLEEAAKSVTEALNALENSTSVASFFRERGIKGTGRMCSDCPVTTYLMPFATPFYVACNLRAGFLHLNPSCNHVMQDQDSMFAFYFGPKVRDFVYDVTNRKDYTVDLIHEE